MLRLINRSVKWFNEVGKLIKIIIALGIDELADIPKVLELNLVLVL